MREKKNWLMSFNNAIMASCLALMSIFVFTNVVLRYAFNSGITWSEELSRYLFVWMTFLGAIAALKDKKHLEVDMFVSRLPGPLKKVVMLVGQLIMLGVLWLLLEGSWKMTLMSMNSKAPATGLPLSYVYGVGIIASVGMGLVVLVNLYRLLFDKESLTPSSDEPKDSKDSFHAKAAGGEK